MEAIRLDIEDSRRAKDRPYIQPARALVGQPHVAGYRVDRNVGFGREQRAPTPSSLHFLADCRNSLEVSDLRTGDLGFLSVMSDGDSR